MFKKFSLLRPLLAILLITIPLYPKFPLFGVTGTYVAIRLEDYLIAISVFILAINIAKNNFSVFKFPVSKLLIAYFVAITISFITSIFIFQTEPKNILLLHLFRRFEYMSLFFLSFSAVSDLKDIKHQYIFTFLASIGVSIYAYGQKFFQFPVISTMNEEFSKGQLLQMNIWTRISSTFAGHYDLAAYLSVLLIIVAGTALITKNIFFKTLQLLVWLNLYYLLTLTASRVSIFAFLFGMIVMLTLIRKYLFIIPVVFLFSLSIINSKDLNQRLLATIPALKNQFAVPTKTLSPTIIPIPTLIPTTSPVIAGAIPTPTIFKTLPTPTPFRHPPTQEVIPADIDAGVARSGEIRFNVEWPRALNAFLKNPLTGTGLGSISLATDNDYLRLLGESGILGFTTFGVIFIYLLVKSFSLYTKKNFPVLILSSALLTMLLNATLIDVFEASKVAYLFWIMIGIYYRLLALHDQQK